MLWGLGQAVVYMQYAHRFKSGQGMKRAVLACSETGWPASKRAGGCELGCNIYSGSKRFLQWEREIELGQGWTCFHSKTYTCSSGMDVRKKEVIKAQCHCMLLVCTVVLSTCV